MNSSCQASTGLAVGRVQEAQGDRRQSAGDGASQQRGPCPAGDNRGRPEQQGAGPGLAAKAVALNPRSAAAALALSYAQQAHFDIAGALATLEKAEAANPGNAELKARLAELQLSVGELDKAQKTRRGGGAS